MGEQYITATFEFNDFHTYLTNNTDGVIYEGKKTFSGNSYNTIYEFKYPKSEFFKMIRKMAKPEENKERDISIHGGRSSVGRA